MNEIKELRSNPEVMKAIREAIKARNEGRIQPWPEVKEELGIGDKNIGRFGFGYNPQ